MFTKRYITQNNSLYYEQSLCSIARFSRETLIYLQLQNGEISIHKFPSSTSWLLVVWFKQENQGKCLTFLQSSKFCHIQVRQGLNLAKLS